jgi:hypothetical protein
MPLENTERDFKESMKDFKRVMMELAKHAF